MSGGSLDYAFSAVDSAVHEIRSRSSSPLHLAFARHLDEVSKALRALEWEFSCDIGAGEADDHIRAVLSEGAELEESILRADEAKKSLEAAIRTVSAAQAIQQFSRDAPEAFDDLDEVLGIIDDSGEQR
jgi:hypothetical protein